MVYIVIILYVSNKVSLGSETQAYSGSSCTADQHVVGRRTVPEVRVLSMLIGLDTLVASTMVEYATRPLREAGGIKMLHARALKLHTSEFKTVLMISGAQRQST